jgi:hypothetical protein
VHGYDGYCSAHNLELQVGDILSVVNRNSLALRLGNDEKRYRKSFPLSPGHRSGLATGIRVRDEG